MALTGFNRTCADKSGGVRSISLARAADIENITFDDSLRSVSAVAFAHGKGFIPYHFREYSARFTEKASREYGAMLVKHEVRFDTDPVDAATALAAEQIAGASAGEGMVALVVTQAGERFIVGYSIRLGAGQPLRLAETTADTGKQRADNPLRTIVLQSWDDAFALPFSGNDF